MKIIMLAFGIIFNVVLIAMKIYGDQVRRGHYMKRIITIICSLTVLTAVIFAESDNHEHGDGCTCGPTRWETIREEVFSYDSLMDPETGILHEAVRTLDENNSTAWCIGNLFDATILYRQGLFGLQRIYGIEILPGYAKNDGLFKMNNRPKKMLIEVIDGTDSKGFIYSKEIVLTDKRGYQKFMFNGKNTSEIIREYCVKNGIDRSTVSMNLRLTILEVYKGSRYDDTCISEIRFLDKNGKPIKLLPGYD